MTAIPRGYDGQVRDYVTALTARGWTIGRITRKNHMYLHAPSGARVLISGGASPNRNFDNLRAAVARVEREAEQIVSVAEADYVERPVLVRAESAPDRAGMIRARTSPMAVRRDHPDGTSTLHCRLCGDEYANLRALTPHWRRHVSVGDVTRQEEPAPMGKYPVAQTEPPIPQRNRTQVPLVVPPAAPPAPELEPQEAEPGPTNAHEILEQIRLLVCGDRMAALEAENRKLREALEGLADLARGSLS